MTYVHLALYDPQTSEFVGYAIKDDQADKLQSTNIYRDGEEDKLSTQLNRLNDQSALNQHWPHPQDPDVQALVNDPNYHPLEYVEQEVIDDENSYYVWVKEPELDENGEATGRMVDGPELDREASVIRYKVGKVPVRPTDVMLRIKRACEDVARARAGML